MYSYRMVMIKVGIKSSSFPSSTIIFTRNLCTVECSLVQLSSDIDFLYKDLTDNILFLATN